MCTVLGAATVVGLARGAEPQLALVLVAAVFFASSFAVVLTARSRFAPPYDPDLWQEPA